MDHSEVCVPASAKGQELGEATVSRDGNAAAGGPPGGLAVAALALGVAACGGGGGSTSGTGGSAGGEGAAVVRKPLDDGEAARFVLQTSIAASTSEIAAVRDQGFEPWLNQQMATPAVSAVGWMDSKGYLKVDDNRWWQISRVADQVLWNQLMSSSPEVRTRAALALSEVFVVSLATSNYQWLNVAIAEYWDILSRNAFGDYRTLLEDITLNPAMGSWLNTLGNRKADGKGRVPDENYAREVMQLFSIGLYELNLDGTVKVDGNGDPIETYTNDDVQGLAKAFTGYDLDYSQTPYYPHPDGTSSDVPGHDHRVRAMTTDSSKWRRSSTKDYHSEEEKSFLGVTIPAGTNSQETLRIALDTLANHPNVGPFMARQMIQRLVTSNPSPAYVERVASAFNDNGKGVRGDLGAMFKALWLDEEALDPANTTSTTFGKVREPILQLAQWARTFKATSDSGDWLVYSTADSDYYLGQSPLRSPSVFNFFRPGYVPSNSNTERNGMVAPELQLMNESTIPVIRNFLSSVVTGKHWLTRDLVVDHSAELALASDTAALVDHLELLLTARQLSDFSRTTIKGALDSFSVTDTSSDDDKAKVVTTALVLMMAAPEYIVQR